LNAAQANCRLSGNAEQIQFVQCTLAQQEPHAGTGLVVCNPPYGKRLDLDEGALDYRALGQHLGRAFPAHRYAILCPDAELIRQTGLTLTKIAALDNGGLTVGLYASAPGRT
jgi:putative N6-adenine-specific DNA methylase